MSTIGVFDSGIGGLTVVKALLEHLPHHPIIYLGDTARTPYGNKSAETIIRYSLNNSDYLLRQGADIIVIACNTASSYAVDAIRDHFGVPVFDVISPGAGLAVTLSRNKRIGIIGTRATIAGAVYETKIKQGCPRAKVFSVSCPLLVPLVEEGWVARPETARIVRKYLHPLKNKQIDTLVLGCTHYPVLKTLIQRKIGQRIGLVDSAHAIAEQIRFFLGSEKSNKAAAPRADRCRIMVTDTADQFRKTAGLILRHTPVIEQAELGINLDTSSFV